jgi:hypothetical protein
MITRLISSAARPEAPGCVKIETMKSHRCGEHQQNVQGPLTPGRIQTVNGPPRRKHEPKCEKPQQRYEADTLKVFHDTRGRTA